MNAREALKLAIDTGEFVSLAYLKDMTDAELMQRPHAGCNHVNWQVGHLIAAEHQMIEQVAPGSMPPLPRGFAEKYTKQSAGSNDPAKFASKDELLETFRAQRAATLAALSRESDANFDKATGVEYAPTVGSMYSLQGTHWLMHAGQWAVLRRQLGRPPLF